jgi:hypothetical protein
MALIDEEKKKAIGRGAIINPVSGSTFTGGVAPTVPRNRGTMGQTVPAPAVGGVRGRGYFDPNAQQQAAVTPSIASTPAAVAPSTPKPPSIGNGLDAIPIIPGVAATQPGPISALAATGAGNAETAAINPPSIGVRKIVGKDGATTYTNDPLQPGGAALKEGDGRGTLSVIGDPRTEGMSPAQAAEYWNSISSGIDAKNATREQERILSDSIIQPGDSIGVIQAKSLNRRNAMQQMNLGVQQQSIADRARGGMIQDPEEQKRRGLETQALGLGVQGKIRELAAQKQVDDLRNKLLTTTDQAERRSLQVQLNALVGKPQDKFQVVTEQGVSDMGTPTKTSFLVDAEGNVKPVSQGANTQIAPAPEAAIAYLRQNPGQKAAFQAKYGYLPEGV